MQKVASILFLLYFFLGCSVVRRGGVTVDSNGSSGTIMEQVLSQNLTNNDFFISRCDIELISGGERQALVGTVKFKFPDKYLISIRSRTGIEAARIFIDKDTLLVNDRINRVLYCGSDKYVRSKYGFSNSVLPVLFGDFLRNDKEDTLEMNCVDEIAETITSIEGQFINYKIDCKSKKALSSGGGKVKDAKQVQIEYGDYFRYEDSLVPGNINIEGIVTGTSIRIEIKKIEPGWKGEIEFIPGNRYEIVKLL